MTKVLLLLLVPKVGPRDPTVENHFPSRILQWNLHQIRMDYKKKKKKKNQNSVKKKKKKKKKKKIEKVVQFQNGGQVTDFYFEWTKKRCAYKICHISGSFFSRILSFFQHLKVIKFSSLKQQQIYGSVILSRSRRSANLAHFFFFFWFTW